MRFEVDWQPTGPNIAAEERATVADLCIFIGDSNACINEQPRRRGVRGGATADRNVRHEGCEDSVTVSVYPLAEEIAFGWWQLFGARDARLPLTDGRAGYALPDVQLAFDGTGFDAICRPITYENPAVRFTGHNAERLARVAAESALTGIVEQVLDRLATSEVRDSGLQLRWQRVQASRRDATESAFCEAAGALGLDPYSIRDEDAEFIVNAGALFSDEPLAELLSGLCMLNWLSGDDDVLAWLRAAEGRPAALSCLPAIDDLRRWVNDLQAAANEMPWCAGYRCARAVRRQLNIGLDERFQVPTLAARLDGSQFEVAETVAGVRAVVVASDDATHVHLPQVPQAASGHQQASELFALARAIGDAVANPRVERSVVNNLHDAARQATGRAFAAEFLAPIDEVLSMWEDGKDMNDIAKDFGVSKHVAERQLQNRERIEQACAVSVA